MFKGELLSDSEGTTRSGCAPLLTTTKSQQGSFPSCQTLCRMSSKDNACMHLVKAGID